MLPMLAVVLCQPKPKNIFALLELIYSIYKQSEHLVDIYGNNAKKIVNESLIENR